MPGPLIPYSLQLSPSPGKLLFQPLTSPIPSPSMPTPQLSYFQESPAHSALPAVTLYHTALFFSLLAVIRNPSDLTWSSACRL